MQKPTFNEAVRFWLKLGFISFGGSAGHLAIMHEYLVDKKKWISESKFLHALSYCMLLPGPEAQQLAIYIGWLLHGIRGGLAAGILFVLPGMFVMLGLSAIYVTFGSIPVVYAIFTGLKPAVIAIIILALIKIGKKSLLGALHYLVALAAFAGLYFLHLPFPVIIIGAVVLAVVAKKFLPQYFATGTGKTDEETASDEEGYVINKNTVTVTTGFNANRVWKLVVVGVVFWVIPFTAFYFLAGDFAFWKKLSLFFTQAAFVTFGGAYAVLPYVAQVSVEKFHWLTNLQMIDGLALGETTPGPLILVLTFVGFMAGHNHFGGSLGMAALALVTTTFYTFLPCFFYIFIGAPVIERTQGNEKLKEILSVVTAAVVGVMLNLAIYLSTAVVFPKGVSITGVDYVSLAWIGVSLVAMYRLNVGMITWIGVSALFGIFWYVLTL